MGAPGRRILCGQEGDEPEQRREGERGGLGEVEELRRQHDGDLGEGARRAAVFRRGHACGGRGAGRRARGGLFRRRREERVQEPDDEHRPCRRGDEGLEHAGPQDVRLGREDRDHRGGVQQHGGGERRPARRPIAHRKTEEEQQPERSRQNQQPVREGRRDGEGRAARARDHRDQRRRLARPRRPGHADEDLRGEHGREPGHRLPRHRAPGQRQRRGEGEPQRRPVPCRLRRHRSAPRSAGSRARRARSRPGARPCRG